MRPMLVFCAVSACATLGVACSALIGAGEPATRGELSDGSTPSDATSSPDAFTDASSPETQHSNGGIDEPLPCTFPEASAHGGLDPSFRSELTRPAKGNLQVVGVLVDMSSRAYVYGAAFDDTTGYDFAVARFLESGALDTSYGGAGDGFAYADIEGRQDGPSGAALDREGRLVVVGASEPKIDAPTPSASKLAVIRFSRDGLVDLSFNRAAAARAGHVVMDAPGSPSTEVVHYAKSLALDGNAIVVAGGNAWTFREPSAGFVFRLDEDGSLATSYPPVYDTTVTGFFGVALRDGNVFISSASYAKYDVRKFAFGTPPSPSFGVNGVATAPVPEAPGTIARALILEPDGKIVVAGGSGKNATATVVRFTAAGALDRNGFSGGVFTDPSLEWDSPNFSGLARACDGKLLVSGVARPRIRVDRLTTSGKLDATWGAGGIGIALGLGGNDYGGAMAIDPRTHKILVAAQSPVTAADPSRTGIQLYRLLP